MSFRQTDMVGRIGGDEFALILPDTSKAAANTVLKKVSRMLERGMQQNGWRITFSIGAVTFLAPPVSVQEMIAGADQLCLPSRTVAKTGYSTKCRTPAAEMPLLPWIPTAKPPISRNKTDRTCNRVSCHEVPLSWRTSRTPS